MSDDSPVPPGRDRSGSGGGREAAGRRDAAAERARPLAREALIRRKRREAAAVVPLAGVILFASPLLDVVADAGLVLGIPASALYIFVAWFALIAVTARLARRFAEDGDGEGG